MSTRERWIVYPLLFLALGTAIKPKLVHPDQPKLVGSRVLDTTLAPATLRVARVECGELVILSPDDERRVVASAAAGGGVIQVFDNQRQNVVTLRADVLTRAGLVETRNESGQLQAVLMSSATGGELAAYGNDAGRSVVVGYRDGRSGLIETNLQPMNGER